MERSLPRDEHSPAGVKSGHLWFSLLAGPLIWIIHMTIVYGLTSLTCVWGWFPFSVGDLSGLQVVQIILTLVALVVTGTGLIWGIQNWQLLQVNGDPDANRHRFMAFLGATMSLLFTALIVIALVPIVTLSACG